MTWPWLILVAIPLALGVAGAATLVRAGRLEAAGRLDVSRVETRRGGFRLATGSAGCAIAAFVSGGPLPGALFLAAGSTALLAGLSRKPRPSGSFASLLFAAAAVAAAFFR